MRGIGEDRQKRSKRIGRLCGLLWVAAVLFVLAACGNEEKKEQEKDIRTSDTKELVWQQLADEPVTFEWYVNYSWFNQSWGENAVSKKITEETGVDIHFITPSGNENEKLNALIASDSLPDLITLGWWETQLNEMIEGDMVYALNELADKYDMYFWEVTNPEAIKWYTQKDGNIYCYPNSCYTAKDLEEHDNIGSNQTFLVRKDIYEAIGRPDMTTPEGFKNAVKKAAEMFPEVDGKPLIPVGAHVFTDRGNVSFDSYLMNFLAVPFEKDGKMYDRYTDKDYITWLKMFRELGEEGYLKDDIFIDQRTQMEEKLLEGRYFCMLYQWVDMVAQEKALYSENPEKIYIAVDGPKNAAGDAHTLPINGINGWTVTFISKNCANPDRAIAFLNYMMSEHGQKRIYLGVEGVTYDKIEGKPVMKEEVRTLLNTNRTEYDRMYGADDTYWMLQDNVMQLQWKYQPEEPISQLQEWSYPYVIYNGQYDFILSPNSKEAHQDSKIVMLWSETLPQLLLAESEERFDEILADFLEKRDSYGYEEVMAVKTELMRQTKEKLGIE